MASVYSEKEIEGLDYFVVLGEDGQGVKPTEAYCTAYAEQNNIDPAKMLIDESWQITFANIDTGQAGGIGLPWDAVVNGDGMIYYWNDTLATHPTAEAAVDALLSGEL